jgi:hypothetical protein
MELFWIDASGERARLRPRAAGETREFHTYAGHVWLVTDAAMARRWDFLRRAGGGSRKLTDGPQKENSAAETAHFPTIQESPDGNGGAIAKITM